MEEETDFELEEINCDLLSKAMEETRANLAAKRLEVEVITARLDYLHAIYRSRFGAGKNQSYDPVEVEGIVLEMAHETPLLSKIKVIKRLRAEQNITLAEGKKRADRAFDDLGFKPVSGGYRRD